MSANETRPDAIPRRPRWLAWVRPRVTIPLAIALALIAAPLVYRQSHVVGLPRIDHPFEPLEFDEAAFASEENALEDYRAARKLRVDHDSPQVTGKSLTEWSADESLALDEQNTRVVDDGWGFATETVAKYVDLNAECLAAWRHGADKPRFIAVPPDHPRLGDWLDAQHGIALPAYVALVLSAKQEHAGELTAAWETLRAVLRASRHSVRGQGIGGWSGRGLVESAIPAVARWARHPQVDAPLLKSALRDVAIVVEMGGHPSEGLRHEYWWHQFSLHSDELRDLTSREHRKGFERWQHDFLHHEPEVTDRCLRHAFANMREFIDRPAWEQPPLVEIRVPYAVSLFDVPATAVRAALPPRSLEPYASKSDYASEILKAFDLSHILRALRSDRARLVLLQATLAAEVGRRETGRYPERIAELVAPGLLDEVPRDPFSPTGEPLRYRLDGDGHLTIWSIGANQIDDDGRTDLVDRRPLDIAIRSNPLRSPDRTPTP